MTTDTDPEQHFLDNTRHLYTQEHGFDSATLQWLHSNIRNCKTQSYLEALGRVDSELYLPNHLFHKNFREQADRVEDLHRYLLSDIPLQLVQSEIWHPEEPS